MISEMDITIMFGFTCIRKLSYVFNVCLAYLVDMYYETQKQSWESCQCSVWLRIKPRIAGCWKAVFLFEPAKMNRVDGFKEKSGRKEAWGNAVNVVATTLSDSFEPLQLTNDQHSTLSGEDNVQGTGHKFSICKQVQERWRSAISTPCCSAAT